MAKKSKVKQSLDRTSARSKNYTFAVGRRKSSVARVRLFKGKGETVVNDTPIGKYFNGPADDKFWNRPFQITATEGKYYATVKVEGGGKKGQLDAVVHGLARVLNEVDKEKFRPPLKKAGLLTRDPRVRERRKVGTGGKARRKKQSPKR